jgi:hypothetical protein
MSDDKKKKDLRARLGRTISPNTPGAAPIAAPAVGAAAAPKAPVAPPVGGGAPAIAPPIAAPIAAPGPKLPFGGPEVAPPPFAQPKAAPARAKAPADPFAAGPAAAAGPQEVRLVIDDKPVDEGEVGKRRRGRNALLLGIGLLVGTALGLGAGSTNSRNVLYNVTVRDGHEIYATVNEASTHVLEAQREIDEVVTAAAGSPGHPPSVDYDSIRALQAIELPIHAGAFARKNYGAFNPGTVDDLFSYYNNVQELWRMFEHLAATTLPDTRRAELDRTAAAAGEAATSLYGVVPQDHDGEVRGSIVFVELPPEPAEGQEASTKLTARSRRGGPGVQLDFFTVETEIGSSPTHVMLVDGAQSAGVLSEQLGAFRSFVSDIREIKTLMDQTVEIQGRLTTSLGEIARLQEVFAF